MRRARPSVASLIPNGLTMQTTTRALYDACMQLYAKEFLDATNDMICWTKNKTLIHNINHNYTLSMQKTTWDFDKTNKDVEMKISIVYEIHYEIKLHT